MNNIEPTNASLNAARAIMEDYHLLLGTDEEGDDPSENIARYIDRETRLPKLLEASKDALNDLEVCEKAIGQIRSARILRAVITKIEREERRE